MYRHKTCGHTIPDAPVVCGVCGSLLCDDCRDASERCDSCCGPICPACQNYPLVRHREAYSEPCPVREHPRGDTIWVCHGCSEKQDEAMAVLKRAIDLDFGPDAWLSDIVAELKEALRTAEKAL